MRATVTGDDGRVGVDPLADVAAQLYALPPDEFVPARDGAAATAKKAGDRRLAADIAKLRKPTVGAWLVNLLAHERPDLVADLLALGDQLRAAQRNLRGEELRELSQRRRATVSALAREAGALGRRHSRGNLPLGDVEATLTAALAEPDVADQVRAGTLTKTVSYAGFGEPPRPQLRLVHGGRDSAPEAPAPAPPVPSVPSKREAERVAAEREAAERDVDAERRAAEREAEAQRRAAEREAEAERRAAERAAEAHRRRERATAHRELLAARTELAEAEAVRAEAERAVTAARRRVEKASAAVRALGDD
jgi:hypothetical protein